MENFVNKTLIRFRADICDENEMETEPPPPPSKVFSEYFSIVKCQTHTHSYTEKKCSNAYLIAVKTYLLNKSFMHRN